MPQARISPPPFQLTFLHPRYWLTWFSILLLYLISWLPYRMQYWLAIGLARLLGKVAKKRVAIADRNLQLCFPDMPEAERRALVKQNLIRSALAIFEAGMGWWWPDWRVRRIGHVEGMEHIRAIQAKGKGTLALVIHNMNLELGCRIVGLEMPCVAFYRRHNNPVMEFVQYRGRARSNKYMIHKRNVKGLIEALDQKELCLYLPDQDYGRVRAEFVPFFAVPDAATTTGTLIFAEKANCENVFGVSNRVENNRYVVTFEPGLENLPSGDDKQDVTRINQRVEELVRRAPEEYLWMHKRFKTRPSEQDESLY